ncbi:Phage virion morphogenesis family protein [compost metagenome]
MSNTIPNFEQIASDILKELPQEIADLALEFFRGSFRKQGFTDYSFIEWVKRKDADTHKILNKSGALEQSLEISSATMSKVQIDAGKGVPYAGIQNTGGTITVRITPRSRKFFWYMFRKTKDNKWKWMALTKKESLRIVIPQRQYIGQSATLLKDIDQYISQKIINRFNKR